MTTIAGYGWKKDIWRLKLGQIVTAQDVEGTHIDGTTDSPKCRMCGKMDENISHIVSECNELVQNEYKNFRHDKVTALLDW